MHDMSCSSNLRCFFDSSIYSLDPVIRSTEETRNKIEKPQAVIAKEISMQCACMNSDMLACAKYAESTSACHATFAGTASSDSSTTEALEGLIRSDGN